VVINISQEHTASIFIQQTNTKHLHLPTNLHTVTSKQPYTKTCNWKARWYTSQKSTLTANLWPWKN